MITWNKTILGNTLEEYATFLLLTFVSIIAAFILRIIARRILIKWAAQTTTLFDDEVIKRVLPPLTWLMAIAGTSLAKEGLTMPTGVALWVDRLLAVAGLIIMFIALARFFRAIVNVLFLSYLKRVEKETNKTNRASQLLDAERVKRQIVEISNMAFVILALISVISNLGVDVKAIWASLGIGGIALVVAVKDPLTNIVGRAYIFSTGVFDVGHFIEFDGWSGTVKRIGIFRTSMELFTDMTTGTIPNAAFVSKPVKSYFGRTKFIYKWNLDVPYSVEAKKVDKLIENLKKLILQKSEVNPASTYIYIEKLGSYSKIVRVWFQVNLPDWGTSLHYGSETIGEIQRLFAEMEIDFAFPTSTVELKPGEEKLFGPSSD
jgi:MscS family membrane protein